MAFLTLFSSALISSYSLFPKPIPLAVDSLLPDHLLRLHLDIFRYAIIAWIPFAFIIRPFLGIFLNLFIWIPIWILSHCFQLPRVLMISTALRKRYFHDRVAGRIRQGSRQVLILGAGYDALAAVFAEMYPTVLFVEVDKPNISQLKRYIMKQTGKRLDNLIFLGVDLSRDQLETQLLKEVPKWDITAKSVVTADNLFMYLTADSVRLLMHSIKVVTPSNTMVVFSYVQQQQTQELKSSSTDLSYWMADLIPKPYKWVAKDAEEVANVIEDDGFYAELAPHESDLYRKYLRDTPFAIENHPFYRNGNGMAMSR